MARSGVAPVLAGILYGALAAGCASSGDLDQLRQEVRASKGQVQNLQGETKTTIESLQKKLEEQERKLTELKSIQDTLAAVSAKLNDTQSKNDLMAKENQELRLQVQLASKTLLDFFKTQDAHLRDELQWVQSALKNLATEEKLPDEKSRALRVR
jgi:outer membrane murein-binding lipoprotein Lpp